MAILCVLIQSASEQMPGPIHVLLRCCIFGLCGGLRERTQSRCGV